MTTTKPTIANEAHLIAERDFFRKEAAAYGDGKAYELFMEMADETNKLLDALYEQRKLLGTDR